MSEASTLHYIHNTLSLPEDREQVSALQPARLAPFNFRVILYTDKSSVKCQLSDYVFLRRVPRRTIIAKTSNLHQKVGYRQDYKYRKLHAYTPKTLTVVLSLVPTRKNQLSATGTYYRKSIH